MPKVIKLSTEESVHLKEKWTHRMEKDFDLHLFAESNVVTAKGLYAAHEAGLGHAIERIEGPQPVTSSVEWLDALPEADYKLLQEALLQVRKGDGGKKNAASA